MAEQIVTLILEDKNTGEKFEIDATGLIHISTTSKGNVQMVSPDGKKLNIESGDNEVHKPASKLQLDTNHYADDTDKKKFKMSVICDKASAVEGINMECAGIDIETAKCDTNQGWVKNQFRLRIKGDNSLDDWGALNVHARSIDLRARSEGDGTGGGIAIQIAGRDSGGKENKFKIETDRTVDVDNTAQANDYNGEGGKGIEIGTINSQYTSLFTKTYRYKGDAPIYGVTRGEVAEAGNGKMDYPTQSDDSKDIIPSAQLADPLTLDKLYKIYEWAKSQGVTF